MMNINQFIDLIGNWISAIGVTTAAIGTGGRLTSDHVINFQLVVVGKALQAFGNALQATSGIHPIAIVGNWIQAVGASTVSVTTYRELTGRDGEINKQIEIIGASFQSIGAYMVALRRVQYDPKREIGNVIFSIGAIFEAAGGLFQLANKEKQGRAVKAVGGVIQTIGANLQAIGTTRDYLYDDDPNIWPPSE
ncbi:hypothetical protein HNQ41_001909 [Texcoconibacillus texcoconensis]|uniref:Uncharacterized protein n=2 Tax=Texcoconibacillus texcoconensis TaxID=1095777 RepID=A0A840QQT8_9BACI|nr:hypothetical protein [Texcoconibacillus texcoconensis]